MCKMFNKTPEDLKYKWEALIYNSSVKDQPIAFFTANSAKDLHQQLQREVTKPSQVKTPAAKQTAAKRAFRNNALSGSSPIGFATPSATKRRTGGVKVEPTTPSLLRSHPKVSTGLPVNFSLPLDLDSYKCELILTCRILC
jgi:hypothetical protein